MKRYLWETHPIYLSDGCIINYLFLCGGAWINELKVQEMKMLSKENKQMSIMLYFQQSGD